MSPLQKKHKKLAVAKRPSQSTSARLGALPEWNLADLYSGLGDPAIKRDLDRVDAECAAFEETYKGKLAEMARAPDAGAALAAAVRRYEEVDDLMGRLGSYAGLVHAGDTIDPVRTKFYGDVQERLTSASTHLLFFTLELNRVDDALLDAAMIDPALGHYRPWLEDVRRYKPYQLEDRIEQLFHEKSVTAYSAWNRLFDQTIGDLRFKVAGKTLPIE
ncbi:MAG: M3 family oligoendopeptidase, partial [Xanthobacteraceae bacterium]